MFKGEGNPLVTFHTQRVRKQGKALGKRQEGQILDRWWKGGTEKGGKQKAQFQSSPKPSGVTTE